MKTIQSAKDQLGILLYWNFIVLLSEGEPEWTVIVQVEMAHNVIQCNYPSDYAVVIFFRLLSLV